MNRSQHRTDVAEDVRAAEQRARPYLLTTPVVPSIGLTASVGSPVGLKCENLQHTGSFKARGAVSKVLAHAEQQLGYPLFERSRGKLVPTPEADQLFAHVTTVNASVDRLRQVAESLKVAEQGSVRVGATTAFGIDFLPRAIAAYRREHGDIKFRVETLNHEELATALLENRLDIGLAREALGEAR